MKAEPLKLKIPDALNNYLIRIKAEQLNFRTWMVKEYKGAYYFEKALIKVDKDGIVDAPTAYLPTALEAAAIQKEWDERLYPTSVLARDTRGIKLHTVKSELFEFYNEENKIIMCQERTDPKGFIPWSMWSDGKWRTMEPDGPLPFWKPKKRRKEVGKLMIHEGAKKAKFANELPKTHPWYDELKEYEHWGIIGGALAVHRADYVDLKKSKPSECIYVCDNDHPGRRALQKISKNYGGKLTGVIFDGRFPPSWDIANNVPTDFYEEDRYVGPQFADFKVAATYATNKVDPEKGEGKGKLVTVIREQFLEEWVHCLVPEVFIHREWPAKIHTTKAFDNMIAPFSQTRETSALVKTDQAGKGMMLRYDPSQEAVTVATEEGHYINTHQPSNVKAEKGDVKRFLGFMDHLIPVKKDRDELLRWCATLIARPDIKMHYGVLLISEVQGVGKGTLGEKILAPLVGQHNVSYPGEEEIVDSKYNYWMAHKRLAVVHEIYAGHSSRAYNKMKSVITDKFIEVHKKYQDDYKIENWIHVFACSNSQRAIKLSFDDRRWLVPRVSEDKRDSGYWADFNHWLARKGGLQFIKQWAIDFGKHHKYVRTGESAPETEIKHEVVEEGMSTGQRLVSDTLTAVRDQMNGHKVLISDAALVELISQTLYEGRNTDKLERPATVRAVAKGLGWHINQKRAKVKAWGTLITRPRLVCSHKDDAAADPVELATGGRSLFDVLDFYNKQRRI
jgi:hypothetical protein